MSWKKVKLSELLKQIKIIVQIDNSKEYKLVTVSSKGTIKQREVVKGVEIKGEKAFEAKKGSFIYSRLSVHNGAFGIVPIELEGALLTSEMPIFDISDRILPEFLIYSLQLPTFKFQLEQLTKGVGRTRVKEANFLSLSIDLPSIEDQKEIVNSFIIYEDKSASISTELTHQLTLVKKLRQQLLQDAVQGKLVEQNPKDEPASELLKKIKAEKEKLISKKKLKKEKELPPIKPEEIPFEIPENWVWCRLNDICEAIIDCPHSTPHYIENETGYYGIDTNCINEKGEITRLRSLSFESYQERIKRLVPKENDIVYAREGSIGLATFIPKDKNVCLGQRVMLFRASKAITHLYLIYAVTDVGYKNRLLAKHRGMGAKHVNVKDIVESLIALPPLAEQNRIVQKLDKLMQCCNELEASIKQSESQNEKLLQQVLREALRKEPVEA